MGDSQLTNAIAAGASLEYQYQHLSPLDAFKAKGRYLHNQLGRFKADSVPRPFVDEKRQSEDVSDAFALDQKLRDRKSNFLTVSGNHVAPSIHSQAGQMDELHRTPSSSSVASRSSQISGSRYASSSIRDSGLKFDFDSMHIKPESPAALSERELQTQHRSRAGSAASSLESFATQRQSWQQPITSTPPSRRSSPDRQGRSHRAKETPGSSVIDNQLPNNHTGPVVNLQVHSQSNRQGRSTTQSPHLQSPMISPRMTTLSKTRAVAPPSRALSYSSPVAESPKTVRNLRSSPASRDPSSRSVSRSDTRGKNVNPRMASLPDAQLSAAVHIELGIEQHEANELPQSTHHFKVAADMGDPTGCLLYGLSLRHGWGIRQDLQRSLAMLQKAVDSIALDQDNARASKLLNAPLTGEVAVAIYELGVSYKNGWGVPTDKKVALKYFELASTWGDVEAMVIAAECYLQGEGCKKDKVKAARYLRRAEGEGKKEIGNSWIWKAKYDP